MGKHLFIPDVQAKEGVPMEHLTAAGNYMVEKQPDTVVCIGDFADMPSLSSYDKGTKSFEGRRYKKDIEAAQLAMETLMAPINEFNARRKKDKKKAYKPRLVMTLGNHENRTNRAVELEPVLDGTISVADLGYEKWGWEVYPYQEIVVIDGIMYSHVFTNPDSLIKSNVGGTIENRLKLLGHSFSMGHQQIFKYGVRHTALGHRLHGLVAGVFYMHNEEYLGPQGNNDWRGIILKQEVHEGTYDPQFLSMNYLLREWL